MKPFLLSAAEHFYQQHRDHLHQYRFFLPNRRSGLLFLHHLKEVAGADTLFAPEVTTLSEYVSQQSELTEAEPIVLLYELYKCYLKVSQKGSDTLLFGDFYHIGERILNDFQDLDKHHKDARELFRNLYELKEIVDDLSYLTDEQRAAITQFLTPLNKRGKAKPLTQTFIDFWSQLYPLYHNYTTSLHSKGIGYAGMILRQVVERIESDESTPIGHHKTHVFLGLNALTPCEYRLLDHLKRTTATLFYWDYDSPLLQGNGPEAYFRRRNLTHYPEPEGADAIQREPITTLPRITLTAIPSSVGQCTYIGQELRRLYATSPDLIEKMQTAVVLPNERLLLPMLNHIPHEVAHLNVTMGYPLSETPLVALLMTLLSVARRLSAAPADRKEWRGQEVITLLSMPPLLPLLGPLCEELSERIRREKLLALSSSQLLELTTTLLGTAVGTIEGERTLSLVTHLFGHLPIDPHEGLPLIDYFITLLTILTAHHERAQEQDALLSHLLFLIEEMRHTLLHRHESEIALPLDVSIVGDVLSTLFRHSRIPYEGEPLHGLQVMGILETRSLDFDRLYIPDASEGILPPKRAVTGIIPHTLRIGYDLPTYEWQERTRAYNFFRLISRAREVVLCYDSRKSDLSAGEPSRYVRLLDYIHHAPLTYATASYPLSPLPEVDLHYDIDVERCARFRQQLTTPHSGVRLSPSSLRIYLDCPRRFYLNYVCNISPLDPLKEHLESKDLGTIVHSSLERLYQRFHTPSYQGYLHPSLLTHWLDDSDFTVQQIVLEEYYRQLRGTPSPHKSKPTGYNSLLYSHALRQVKNVLHKDLDDLTATSFPIRYLGGEVSFEHQLPLPDGRTLNLKGIIDRLDLRGNTLRIIDYKTGSDTYAFALYERDPNKTPPLYNHAALQLFLYCHVIQQLPADHPLRQLLPASYSALQPIINKPMQRSSSGVLEYKTGKGKGVEVQLLTNFLLPEVQEWYAHFLQQLLTELLSPSNPFPPLPNKTHCHYCNVRNLCLRDLYTR